MVSKTPPAQSDRIRRAFCSNAPFRAESWHSVQVSEFQIYPDKLMKRQNERFKQGEEARDVLVCLVMYNIS